MASETPQIYEEFILDYATSSKTNIHQVFSALNLSSKGLTSNVIAGSILEEMNDRHESLFDSVKQFSADTIADYKGTHNELLENYNHLKNNPSTLSEYSNDFSLKLSNPTQIDVGLGNIQIYTAIELLNDYNSQFASSDPLNLKQYNNDYGKMVDHLLNPDHPATASFAGLMVNKAANWFETNASNWNSLSQIQKEGLIVFFYNVGEEHMNGLKAAAGGSYTPNPDATLIAQEYIMNNPSIAVFLNQSLSSTMEQVIQNIRDNTECFPAHTLITLSDRTQKPIDKIKIGDSVLAFDAAGVLQPRKVTKLFTNVTEHFYKLSSSDLKEDLVVTSGHRFALPEGGFETIEAILQRDGRIVLENGEVVIVIGELLEYGAETAHLFEQITLSKHAAQGNLVAKPQDVTGWKTYNFEVEELHTYVAANDNDRLIRRAA